MFEQLIFGGHDYEIVSMVLVSCDLRRIQKGGCVQGTQDILSIHSVQFAATTSSDLLNSQLTKFSLQIIELFREVFLVLAPEFLGLDSCGV